MFTGGVGGAVDTPGGAEARANPGVRAKGEAVVLAGTDGLAADGVGHDGSAALTAARPPGASTALAHQQLSTPETSTQYSGNMYRIHTAVQVSGGD